jgi:carbon dioxide concentrating mechanism protein CcmN
MYLPPLQPANNAELYQIGDVTVDPSAVIGLGVILQASPNGRIVIGPGACLGMGTIVNACEGTIEIEAGAVLGPGVLIVGQGKVGANASVGAVSTIFNASISPMQVLAAGSVIEPLATKMSPNPTMSPTPEASPVNPKTSEVEAVAPTDASLSGQTSVSSQPVDPTNDPWLQTTEEAESVDQISRSETSEPPVTNDSESISGSKSVPTAGTPIYGQIYISRMLGTIFPQGQSTNRR